MSKKALFQLFILTSHFLFSDLARSPAAKYRFDLKNTGRSPHFVIPVGSSSIKIMTKWIVQESDTASNISTPAVDELGRIYIGINSNLNCYDKNGLRLWSSPMNAQVFVSPALSQDGKIHMGSHSFHNNGELYWNNPDINTPSSSPALRDGKVFSGKLKPRPQILMMDADTGVIIKSNNFTSPIDLTNVIDTVVPEFVVLDTGMLFTPFFSNDVFIFNFIPPSGSGAGSGIPTDGGSAGGGSGGGGSTSGFGFLPPPALSDDNRLYLTGKNNLLRCIIVPEMTNVWESETDGTNFSSPALGYNGEIYVASSDGYLYCFDQDGNRDWRTWLYEPIFSAPTIGKNQNIIVVNGKGTLFCISPNGSIRWETTVGGSHVCSSPVIAEDGTIYQANDQGGLFAFRVVSDLKDLQKTIVGPNPYIPNDGQISTGTSESGIVFSELPASGVISVFTSDGKKIHSERFEDINGRYRWYVPKQLSSGLYRSLVKDKQGHEDWINLQVFQ